MQKRVLILAIFCTALIAKESFYIPNYAKAAISMQKQYCKVYNTRTFYSKCTLIYPDFSDSDAPKFFQFLTPVIKPYIQKFQKCNPKERAALNPNDKVPTADYFDEITIDISNVTPTTYTVLVTHSEFSGEPYINSYFTLKNYLRKNGKLLKYKDLFKKGAMQEFIKIAKTVFKKEYKLKANEDLRGEKTGWYKNQFQLPENFAITKDGLWLSYNVYEVTPRSVAPPEFLIPYSKLRNIIKPKGPIAFGLNPKESIKHFQYRFIYNLGDMLFLKIDKIDSQTLKLDILLCFAKSDTLYKRNWFTLQFPSLKRAKAIKEYKITQKDDEFFHKDKVKIYPAKTALYNFKRKKKMLSKWLEVELETNDSDSEVTNHHFVLTLHFPKNAKRLLYMRIARERQDGKILREPQISDTLGEQGLKVDVLKLPK